MLPLGNWTGSRFGSSRKPDRRRCVPARSLLRTDDSFVQSTDAQRRRRRLCSGNGRWGGDLVRSDGGKIQDSAHWFRWYSLATFMAAITLPWWLIRFGANAANVGLFQRASLSVLNLWLFVFAVVVSSRLHVQS